MERRWLARLWTRWRGRFGAARRTPQEPLLDAAALAGLAELAGALPTRLLAFTHPADQPLAGERPSPYRGRGFEFEENRPYLAGDEPRLLNWRLYARTGALHTKVFTEERRPALCLLVDRRAAMRFGTRRQLKAALAAKIAACHLFQARQQALPVGGLLLEQPAAWFAPALGAGLQPLLHALAAAAPPLAMESGEPTLHDGLQRLLHALPAGCQLVLVSDFADLDPRGDASLLAALAARHTVRAFRILDPVERVLPTDGDYLIDDPGAPQPLRIDGRDALQRHRYAAAFRARQAALAELFAGSRIPWRTCATTDALNSCLEPADATA